MSNTFIEKGTQAILENCDATVYITKSEDGYKMKVSSEQQEKKDGYDDCKRCEFDTFSDFENFIIDFSPRNIYFSIYKQSPVED